MPRRQFPSLREAEIAYGLLEDRLIRLEQTVRRLDISGTQQAAKAPVIITQTATQSESVDSTLSADGSKVIHNLQHIFNANTIIEYLITQSSVAFNDPQDPDHNWYIELVGDILRFSYINPTTSDLFQMEFGATASYATNQINFVGILGDSSSPVDKGHFRELRVLADTPAIGEVLTATDTSGNMSWQPVPTPAVLTLQEQASTSDLNLTTSYGDVPGASLTLTVNGVYLIVGTFYFNKVAADDFCVGRIDWDGTPLTPIAFFGRDASATTIAMQGTVTIHKKITVTSQPDTVKLQAGNNAGAGASVAGSGHCQIQALLISRS